MLKTMLSILYTHNLCTAMSLTQQHGWWNVITFDIFQIQIMHKIQNHILIKVGTKRNWHSKTEKQKKTNKI